MSLPIPDTPNFRGSLRGLEHCPIFFEKGLQHKVSSEHSGAQTSHDHTTYQPLAVLPSQYGETLDWVTVNNDPLLMLQELFYFQTAAAAQYLDMLRKLIEDVTARLHPTGDISPTMDDILHFEYSKTVLVRWSSHFSTFLLRLEEHLRLGAGDLLEEDKLRQSSFAPIRRDMEYLCNEAKILVDLCESGKITIMGSFSVYASRRAADESSLVTKLTKAANRITLIFLPISLVTSAFGMNFRQLGQGPLSITLRVTITLPLLTICILVSEWGGIILRSCRGWVIRKHTN